MEAVALMEETLDSREPQASLGDRRRRRRPDPRLARLRLRAAGGEVDVDAVADAIVRRLAFTAALRAELSD